MSNKLIIFVIIILSVIAAVVFILYLNGLVLQKPVLTPTPTGSSVNDKPAVAKDCKVTGCSGQICSDDDVITTCEYKTEYVCYKTAKCERQEDGKCGWTPTEELVACLGAAFQAEEI